MTIKQVIVMRNDLNMRKGKMVAQGAHASIMFLVMRHIGKSSLKNSRIQDGTGNDKNLCSMRL